MNNDFKIKQKLKSVTDFKAQKKYLHAIQICEKLIVEFPHATEIYLELAELHELSGNVNSALQLLESYLSNFPDDKDIKLLLGQFLIKNGLWHKAIEIFSAFTPEEKPVVLFYLGYSYFMIKDFEMARINYLSFLTLEKDQELVYESYLYLAKIEIEMGDFEQALSYVKQSELIFNSYWELYLISAICYYNLGMDTHAVLSIEKSIKLNSKILTVYEWAGKIFLRSRDYEKAEKYFVKYVESADEVAADTYAQLAETCLRLNKNKSALNYFELALKLDPNNQNALIGLEKIPGKMTS